jgi:hypothetical protein
MKSQEKYLAKIGKSKTIHMVKKDQDLYGRDFYYSLCGADHRTNNGTGGVTTVYEYNPEKITCKKCLKKV